MEWFNVLSAAVVGGSALGATLAGFFAWQQKSRVTLLRETVDDYKTRTEQLEEENRRKDETISAQNKRIDALESEKRLPLENLTRQIAKQHTDQMKSLAAVAAALAELAKHLTVNEDAK